MDALFESGRLYVDRDKCKELIASIEVSRLTKSVKTELSRKRNSYNKKLTKTKTKIDILRAKLTKQRNKEQYLNRCVRALNDRLGDIADGQLEFKM